MKKSCNGMDETVRRCEGSFPSLTWGLGCGRRVKEGGLNFPFVSMVQDCNMSSLHAHYLNA